MAFSQEKLDARGLKNIDDLSRLSPGLTFQRNGMSSAGNYNDEGSDINIRGVDSTAGTSTTGIYIDDSPIQTRHIGFGSINAFPALVRPRSRRSAARPAGHAVRRRRRGRRRALHFARAGSQQDRAATRARTSRPPTAARRATRAAPPSARRSSTTCSHFVRASRSAATAVGSTGSATRSSRTARCRCHSRLQRRTTEANANFSETTTARLALKWKVSDALEITPSIYYQRLQINDTSAYWVALSDPSSNVYRNGNFGTNPSSDPFTLSALKIRGTWDSRRCSRTPRTTTATSRRLPTTRNTCARPGTPSASLAEHLSVGRRQRLCHVPGRSAQFLSGVPAGFERHECADRLERRALLLALERERAGEHHRSHAEPGGHQLHDPFRARPPVCCPRRHAGLPRTG